MTDFKNNNIKIKFNTYPSDIKIKLLSIRELIFNIANNEKTILEIEETLKWNEPSYITKNGSTLRIDWKKNNPNHYSIYFNCKTKLIETFRELFSDKFEFIGNREIKFHINDTIDIKALSYCILLSLTYHDRKHLIMLDE